MTLHRRALLGAIAAAPAVHAARAQVAARFPDRPVRFVVAYAAGGAADNQNRLVAQKLAEVWGRPVVVENKPGGNTLIATETVMRAPADGHTLLSVSLPFGLNPLMFDRLPYDPFRDFIPVALMSTIPNILVVHPDFPARTLQEFVAYAKANPGKVAVAHTGIGAITHLSGELLYDRAGIEVTTIAYGGSAPAHVDVLSGRVPAMFDSSMLPHIAAGRVRPLGVTSRQRVALLPDIPSIAEQGFPDFDAAAFYGLVAPRGTPAEVVETLSAAIRGAVGQPDVQEKMKALTFAPGDTTPAQFEAFIRREVALWGGLVKRRNIRPDG